MSVTVPSKTSLLCKGRAVLVDGYPAIIKVCIQHGRIGTQFQIPMSTRALKLTTSSNADPNSGCIFVLWNATWKALQVCTIYSYCMLWRQIIVIQSLIIASLTRFVQILLPRRHAKLSLHSNSSLRVPVSGFRSIPPKSRELKAVHSS